ncbi:hypothetical protein AQ938_15885 [Burkholderia pseudomallei]|nr:hypothetical protein SZ31_21005 [Burkholderia pseudomallei]OMR36770.1 hypothetical protein AQ724_19220 [Burkholderia pseudomallei]OMT71929.1 hypothetical protein AQ764_07030 [Burkholderia pseudomallei]ONA42159.1 hypothetical protein AQ878_12325 [Burkholderia pseudomallei]OND56941.1 hypothetical protein AQ935_18215 [Burkholderia pseudomallei]
MFAARAPCRAAARSPNVRGAAWMPGSALGPAARAGGRCAPCAAHGSTPGVSRLFARSLFRRATAASRSCT